MLDARSAKAKREFRKIYPCPSTGKHSGKCPNYEIDHIHPLKCGGADYMNNMQWLSIKQHKAKTKAQAKMCRKKSI